MLCVQPGDPSRCIERITVMNEDTIKGKLKSVGGKIEQAAGETFGDQKMANAGTANQVKGATQETWGNVKDAAHDVTTPTHTSAEVEAHNTRTGIAETAEHLKDKVSHGIDSLKSHFQEERDVHQVH